MTLKEIYRRSGVWGYRSGENSLSQWPRLQNPWEHVNQPHAPEYKNYTPEQSRGNCEQLHDQLPPASEWVSTHRLNASVVLQILDDFLFIAPTRAQCAADLANFSDYVSIQECQQPTRPDTTLQFAGVTLDSLNMEARFLVEKLQKCNTLISQFYRKRIVTLKELQSLIGLLSFACSVVVPGRAFPASPPDCMT